MNYDPLHDQIYAPVRQVRLLEFNRPAHSPWLTVPLAEEEIVIQDANDEHCFTDEYGCEVIRG